MSESFQGNHFSLRLSSYHMETLGGAGLTSASSPGEADEQVKHQGSIDKLGGENPGKEYQRKSSKGHEEAGSSQVTAHPFQVDPYHTQMHVTSAI